MGQREDIERLLGEKTLKEIARNIGVSESTVKRRMKEYGLKQPQSFIEKNRLASASAGGRAYGNKVRKTEEEKKETVNKRYKRRYGARKEEGMEYLYNMAYRIRKLQRKKKCVEYKGGKCQRCGYNKCIAALEFHHRNPEEKEITISSSGVMNWEKLKEELDKCDLLCSNCHKEEHYKELSETRLPSSVA